MKKYWLFTAPLAVLAAACADQPATAPTADTSPTAIIQSAPAPRYQAFDLGVQLAGSPVIDNEGVGHGVFVAGDGTSHVFRWSAGVFTDLGALPSGASVMSPGGTAVAGFICNEYCNPITTAYVWRAGVVTLLDLGRTFQTGRVIAVTDDGDVLVLGGENPNDDVALVFRGGNRFEIQSLQPGRPFGVSGMNRRGQVAGFTTAPGYDSFRAFIWENGTMTFLPELGPGTCSYDPNRQCAGGRPFAVNDHGDVVGQATYANGPTHAVLWPSSGTPIDLGGFFATLVNEHEQVVVDNTSLWDNGNRQSFDGGAIALNDHGVVTGGVFTPEFKSHAFVWDAGTFTDLGTGPGDNSRGLAINIRGDVIGYYFGSDFVTKAMVWLKVN